MRKWVCVILACAVVGVSGVASAGKIPPVPDNPMQAQTSLGYSTRKSCPDLRISDEGTLAVLVFWLPSSGIPTRISIKTSSGSSELDAAAMSCAAKLRFAPATRLGDGEALDSWQQIGFRWVMQGYARPAGAGQTSGPTAGTTVATTGAAAGESSATGAPAGAGAAAGGGDGARAAAAGRQGNSVTVRVCVDEKAKGETDRR